MSTCTKPCLISFFLLFFLAFSGVLFKKWSFIPVFLFPLQENFCSDSLWTPVLSLWALCTAVNVSRDEKGLAECFHFTLSSLQIFPDFYNYILWYSTQISIIKSLCSFIWALCSYFKSIYICSLFLIYFTGFNIILLPLTLSQEKDTGHSLQSLAEVPCQLTGKNSSIIDIWCEGCRRDIFKYDSNKSNESCLKPAHIWTWVWSHSFPRCAFSGHPTKQDY